MAASYVSARFEKTDLYPQLGLHRCIVRNLDSDPTRPTTPDQLRDFLLIEYVNDSVGERLSGVATLGDYVSYGVQTLNRYEVLGADFVAAGVLPGDLLTITLAEPQEWTSEEYASTAFLIDSVVDPEHLELAVPFPSFKTALTWQITRDAAPVTSGTSNGTTRREGMPAPLDKFLDRRVNALFTSVPLLDTFVEATKAGMDALASASTSSTLSNESYTTQV